MMDNSIDNKLLGALFDLVHQFPEVLKYIEDPPEEICLAAVNQLLRNR